MSAYDRHSTSVEYELLHLFWDVRNFRAVELILEQMFITENKRAFILHANARSNHVRISKCSN